MKKLGAFETARTYQLRGNFTIDFSYCWSMVYFVKRCCIYRPIYHYTLFYLTQSKVYL